MSATVVLDQQQRNGAFSTGSILAPPGAQLVTLNSTMSDADAQDTAKSCRLKIGQSYDDGETYYYDAGAQLQWQGGFNRFGEPNVPNITVSLLPDPRADSPTYGQLPNRVMATADTEGNTLNMGLTLETR